MTKHSQWTVVLAILLAALIPVGASAATAAPPKVVFIGDQFTYMWALPHPSLPTHTGSTRVGPGHRFQTVS